MTAPSTHSLPAGSDAPVQQESSTERDPRLGGLLRFVAVLPLILLGAPALIVGFWLCGVSAR